MQYGEYIKILYPKKLIDKVLEVGHITLDKYNIYKDGEPLNIVFYHELTNIE